MTEPTTLSRDDLRIVLNVLADEVVKKRGTFQHTRYQNLHSKVAYMLSTAARQQTDAPQKQTFADAVRESNMSDEDKAYWLEQCERKTE